MTFADVAESDDNEEQPEDNWFKELSVGPGTSDASTSAGRAKRATTTAGGAEATAGPGKELNDIAATARSIQPTGYTLETTKVTADHHCLVKCEIYVSQTRQVPNGIVARRYFSNDIPCCGFRPQSQCGRAVRKK